MPAGSVITRGNNPRLLREDVRALFSNAYNEHEKQFDKVYGAPVPATHSFEIDVQWGSFGPAPKKAEGAGVVFDSKQQGITPKYDIDTFALAFSVSEENMEDNKHNLFSDGARGIAFSLRQSSEIEGANVLNRGFNSAFVMKDGDGESLFSASHRRGPDDDTLVSNQLDVPASLSEAAVEALLIKIGQAKDTRGNPIALKGLKLIIPPTLPFEAQRITKSVLQSATANNDLNAMRSMGMLREGFFVNNYLSSEKAWFIITDVPKGLTHMVRRAVKFQEDNVFDTSNLAFKASQRETFGWSDFLGAFGSPGI